MVTEFDLGQKVALLKGPSQTSWGPDTLRLNSSTGIQAPMATSSHQPQNYQSCQGLGTSSLPLPKCKYRGTGGRQIRPENKQQKLQLLMFLDSYKHRIPGSGRRVQAFHNLRMGCIMNYIRLSS